MIDRGEVVRILNSIKGNRPTARASITSERLAALCRRWLAVEDAPKAVVECNDAKGAWLIAADDAPLSGGQRVHIVPEDG